MTGDSSIHEYAICDNGVQKLVQVCFDGCSQIPGITYLDNQRNTTIPPTIWTGVSFGNCGTAAPVAALGTVTRSEVAATAASVASGKQAVTILNVGTANGTVLTGPIYPGETVTLQAYLDPVTSQFNRLPAVPYDCTNTTFHITTVN
jgi:hypothetical protein